MWPHAVLVDEWLRALAASRRARGLLAAALALAVAVPFALAAAFGEAPKPPLLPHVQQDPRVGPPELVRHDVFLGFRPRIEGRRGARAPVLRKRTPLRPRLELPEPVELASREAAPQRARSAASGVFFNAAPAQFAAARRPLAATAPKLSGPALLSLPPAPLPRRADDGSTATEGAPSAAPVPTLVAATIAPPARAPAAPAASSILVARAPGRAAAAPAAAPVSPSSAAGPVAPQAGSVVETPVALLPHRSATGAVAVDRNARPVGTAELDIRLSGAPPAQATDGLLVASTLELPGPLNAPPAAGFASRADVATAASRASDVLAELAVAAVPEWAGGDHFSAMVNVAPAGDALRVQTIPTGFAIAAIPEPSTGVLLALGLAALVQVGRRR